MRRLLFAILLSSSLVPHPSSAGVDTIKVIEAQATTTTITSSTSPAVTINTGGQITIKTPGNDTASIIVPGPQGIPGTAGINGADGPAGVDGLPGPAGADGADGPQGIQGETGPAGSPDTRATIIAKIAEVPADNTLKTQIKNAAGADIFVVDPATGTVTITGCLVFINEPDP